MKTTLTAFTVLGLGLLTAGGGSKAADNGVASTLGVPCEVEEWTDAHRTDQGRGYTERADQGRAVLGYASCESGMAYVREYDRNGGVVFLGMADIEDFGFAYQPETTAVTFKITARGSKAALGTPCEVEEWVDAHRADRGRAVVGYASCERGVALVREYDDSGGLIYLGVADIENFGFAYRPEATAVTFKITARAT